MSQEIKYVSKSYKLRNMLIAALLISNIAFVTLFFNRQASAGSAVLTIGSIEVYDEDGVSPLTSYNFPFFAGGESDYFGKYFFVKNTGNQPVYVYWNISTGSIVWEVKDTVDPDVYVHFEDGLWKYSFGVEQSFVIPVDYLIPNNEAIVLSVGQKTKLRFELYYTGEPGSAEAFTMTINFYASSKSPQDPVAMLEDLKTRINELPPEAFRYPRYVGLQKRELCAQIDNVIKSVKRGNNKLAILQLELLKLSIRKQIRDPYKGTLIEKIDKIIDTLK